MSAAIGTTIRYGATPAARPGGTIMGPGAHSQATDLTTGLRSMPSAISRRWCRDGHNFCCRHPRFGQVDLLRSENRCSIFLFPAGNPLRLFQRILLSQINQFGIISPLRNPQLRSAAQLLLEQLRQQFAVLQRKRQKHPLGRDASGQIILPQKSGNSRLRIFRQRKNFSG